MYIPFARVAILGLGGASAISGTYLMLKPDSKSTEDTAFSTYYDSVRNSLISEEDREELERLGLEVQSGVTQSETKLGSAALWLLENDKYKSLFSDIAKIVKKEEGWEHTTQSLGAELKELYGKVQEVQAENKRNELPEDKIVSKALRSDLENIKFKLPNLRSSCSVSKKVDCNLEHLFLPIEDLLKAWDKEDTFSFLKAEGVPTFSITPKNK